jgi:molybdopterin-guanine dinucleotide biosynthesis protein A
LTQVVAGLLLAGGLSRRMGGGDKMLAEIAGLSLLERVMARAMPQVAALALNINGDPARFPAAGLPIVADVIPGHAGPLAGILSGLEWVQASLPGTEWMISFATDTPLLPLDLVARLQAAVAGSGAEIGCPRSDGRAHPVFALWPVRLAGEMRRALVDEDMRKVGAWMARYRVAYVDWPGGADDPFLNVNTPDDLALLRGRLDPA